MIYLSFLPLLSHSITKCLHIVFDSAKIRRALKAIKSSSFCKAPYIDLIELHAYTCNIKEQILILNVCNKLLSYY